MTVWHIVEPITIPAEYHYPHLRSVFKKAKPYEKQTEITFDPAKVKDEVERLIRAENRSIDEISQTLGHSRRTVRSVCRTFKLGPYAEPTAKCRRSVSSQVPYGWTLLQGLLSPDPAEMKRVIQMKKMRQQGKSLHRIARFLNEAKVPTKNNGRWHAKTVSQVLKFNQTKQQTGESV